jgi:hypothetical protein
MPDAPAIYGLMAEFDDPTSLIAAARRTQEAGYRAYDSFSPYPIHELFDAMQCEDRRVSLFVLIGGIIGLLSAFGLQAWVAAVAYPLNVAGRPYISWPMFIPVTFEMAVLGAGLFTLVGLLVLNRLPQPYHPVFNVAEFARASRDRFFLCIEAQDARFEPRGVHAFFSELGAVEVADVPE